MDLSKIKDTKDLQELVALMARYDLAEIELADGERVIRLRRPEAVLPAREVVPVAAPAASAAPSAPSPEAAAGESAAELEPSNLNEVPSPMVGTFYRAPSPEGDPFVVEGDRVEPSTVLCIIEAMKVMNEISAGVSGIVREVLVKNGESVEYGQALFRIEAE